MSYKDPGQEAVDHYLKDAKTVAVVGLSSNPEKTSYKIAAFLKDKGYTIIPVNPRLVGEQVLGETVYGSLKDVPVQIDIVDVFRRSEFLPAVADEFLQTDAKVFWAQLGLENAEAADKLYAAGRADVVMNRCVKIEYNKRAE